MGLLKKVQRLESRDVKVLPLLRTDFVLSGNSEPVYLSCKMAIAISKLYNECKVHSNQLQSTLFPHLEVCHLNQCN